MTNQFLHIKHISLDFWNTLAAPNLEYSHERTNLIANTFDIPFDEAKRVYTSTKKFMDTAAELVGFAARREVVVEMFNAQMPPGHLANASRLEEFTFKMDYLFQHNIPTISPELVEVLKEIKSRGINFGVLSNTNFIRGALLRGVVLDPALGVDFFSCSMFSDEWQLAKPSSEFFSAMAQFASRKSDCSWSQIVHIGDNLITDVQGADNIGVLGLHVTDPTDLVRLLQGMLE